MTIYPNDQTVRTVAFSLLDRRGKLMSTMQPIAPPKPIIHKKVTSNERRAKSPKRPLYFNSLSELFIQWSGAGGLWRGGEKELCDRLVVSFSHENRKLWRGVGHWVEMFSLACRYLLNLIVEIVPTIEFIVNRYIVVSL